MIEFNFFSRVEVDILQVLLKVRTAGLEGVERFGNFFFEFGSSSLKLGKLG